MSHLPLAASVALLACHSTTAQEVAAVRQSERSVPRTVAILLYEGVELLDFAGPGEVFSAAHGEHGRAFRVVTVAKEKAPLTSQGFVRVTPEYSIADCPPPDIAVVPGGNVPEDPELGAWLRGIVSSGGTVMSVCNGAYLLASAGLLDGLEVTTHHGSLAGLAGAYPKLRVSTNRRFVDSGQIVTTAGVSAGIDGALHVVERLHGVDTARGVARYMEYDWRREEIEKLHAEPGRRVGEGPTFALARTALEQGVEPALGELRALAPQPDEAELGATAHALMRLGKLEESLALLRLQAAAFPRSASARDCLADACERAGDERGACELSRSTLALLDETRERSELASRLRIYAASRLARLGQGDAAKLRYACPPCGGDCDSLRFVGPTRCSTCGMELMELAAR